MAAGLNDFTGSDAAAIVMVDDVESLFRAHYGRLVRALTLVAGSQDLAADAVQEAFVKAHLHWRRIRRYDDPVGWIRRVAINKLRDEHRRDDRKQLALRRLSGLRDSASTGAAIDHPPVDGDGETLRLLADLPRQQRLSLALFYIDQLSIAEVASTLRISEGAVKFHLHQGRARLRADVQSGAAQ
jgi:RNA polymerase sigma-70 factor (ECF subfamily)